MLAGLSRNPEKLEARALQYEQAGKNDKAVKYREKANRIRAQKSGVTTQAPAGSTFGGLPFVQRTPASYEQNALKWEQRGNWTKAQKNREKVWRLNNPQYANSAAPSFYQNNQFLGYNVPLTGSPALAGPTLFKQQTGITQQTGFVQQTGFAQQQTGFGQHSVLPTTVETHVHPTILEQTSRPERIVEVQPIVHREIDAPQVRIVEKHLYETVASQGPHTVTNAPIVQETFRPRVIEEIQPVVHREVPAPFVERVEQHVTEHIVQPTTTTKQVINGGAIQQQPFIAAGGPALSATGAPISQTTTTTTTTQNAGLMGKVQNVLHR